MLAKTPNPVTVVDLGTRADGRSWFSFPSTLTTVIGCVREPFTVLQREHQADHADALDGQELRIGQRTT